MRYGFVCLPLLLLASCAHFVDKPLVPEDVHDDFMARSFSQPALIDYVRAHGETAAPAWSLRDLTLAAFYYHPELAVARASAEVAEGEILAADEHPNPTISLVPAFNSTTPAYDRISSWIIDAAMDIPRETANKKNLRVAAARHLSAAARDAVGTAAWRVRMGVREALLSLYTAGQTAELLEEQTAIQESMVTLLEKQRQAGEVSPFEVTQARIARDSTRLDLEEAHKVRDEARARLASAIGVPVRALEGITLSYDAFETLPAALAEDTARRLALLGRSDVHAALENYAASQSALQLEIAKQRSDISILPGYSYDQSENKWALGLSFTLPLANLNEGAIATATARREVSAAQMLALQARIIGGLETASASYTATLRKLQTAQALAKELQKNARTMQQMYEIGEISKLEVSSANLEVSVNALAQLQARVDALGALGQVEDALQIAPDLDNWRALAEAAVNTPATETSNE